MLNPITHSRTRESADIYRVEPYVVVADVYSEPPFIGRGGWVVYRVLRLDVQARRRGHPGYPPRGRDARIDPVIPHDWEGFGFTYRYGESVYRVKVVNPDGVSRGVVRSELDGQSLSGPVVPLVSDGDDHDVHVRMGVGPSEG